MYEVETDLIHWDYVYIENSNTGQRYILVVKDDASKYVWLKAVADADALTTREVLLDWFSSLVICYRWVSDQGSHFKNAVIEDLRHSLGAYHHLRLHDAHGQTELLNWSTKSSFVFSCPRE